MQNNFSVKDFILFLLVGAVLLSVWLGMKQVDRQWKDIQIIKDQVADVQDRLEKGVSVGVGGGATTQATAEHFPGQPADKDPFSRMEAAHQMKGYASGDWLIWGFAGNVAKITPLLSGDEFAYIVQGEVLESLAIRDPNTLDWKPLLAKSWKISDNGLKITFNLRDNLHFSDGTPLTADDVVFTYNFIMNPKINAPRDRAYYERVQKVVKDGPLQVTFYFAEPYFKSFELAAGMSIFSKKFYGQFKTEDYNNSVGYLLGSGPYQLEDPTGWKPGQFIQLVRNPRYWGVQPALNRILFKQFTLDKAELAAFRNGDMDFMRCNADQYRQMILDESLVSRTHHFNFNDPTQGYRYIGWNESFNGKPTVFADKRVRRAMTMLLDRNRIIQEIMYGYATIASGPFYPMGKQADPNVKPLPYDVEGAKKLLAEAGFKYDAKDAVLKDANGKPFRFKLTYPSGSSNYDRMVLYLKDAYARVGIVMIPNALEWGGFSEMMDKRNFEAVTLGWGGTIDDDPYQIFDSHEMAPGADDFISYKDPAVDKLIETARSTIDEKKRNEMWHEVHRLINEDQPYTFLFYPQGMRFVDGRMHNVDVTLTGLNDPTEWFVPRSLQKYHQ